MTQLPQSTINFQQLAQNRTNKSDTPFRDMLSNGFGLVGGAFEAGQLTMYLITNELFIEKQKSDAKMIRSAINLDQEQNESALFIKLRNQELMKAMNQEPSSVVPNA